MRLCLGCGRTITGQQRLQSFARMVERGLSAAEARSKSPRCYYCTGLLLRAGCVSDSEETVKQEVSHATNR
jgi:hypothetical protein